MIQELFGRIMTVALDKPVLVERQALRVDADPLGALLAPPFPREEGEEGQRLLLEWRRSEGHNRLLSRSIGRIYYKLRLGCRWRGCQGCITAAKACNRSPGFGAGALRERQSLT